jgi:ubiquinone biosynthesis protein UbiJ
MFERGFDLLGLKLEETTEPFEGAATAVHPLLIESAVKFQSRASQELFPAAGPVKTQVLGDATEDKQRQASRVQNFMNYQLTEQMPEYFDEFERMLFHLPLIGSAFKKDLL